MVERSFVKLARELGNRRVYPLQHVLHGCVQALGIALAAPPKILADGARVRMARDAEALVVGIRVGEGIADEDRWWNVPRGAWLKCAIATERTVAPWPLVGRPKLAPQDPSLLCKVAQRPTSCLRDVDQLKVLGPVLGGLLAETTRAPAEAIALLFTLGAVASSKLLGASIVVPLGRWLNVAARGLQLE